MLKHRSYYSLIYPIVLEYELNIKVQTLARNLNLYYVYCICNPKIDNKNRYIIYYRRRLIRASDLSITSLSFNYKGGLWDPIRRIFD